MSCRGLKRAIVAFGITTTLFIMLIFLTSWSPAGYYITEINSAESPVILAAVAAVPAEEGNIEIEGCSPPAPTYSGLFPAVYDDDRGLKNAGLPALNSIPPLLHLQWKSRRLPSFAFPNLRAWKRLHPSWRIVLWTDDDLHRLATHTLGAKFALGAIFNALPQNIIRVDFTRYLILQLFGGVYADIDVLPLRDITPVLKQHSCVLAREPEPFCVSIYQANNAILASNVLMASRPGHPFWGVLMGRIKPSNGHALGVAGPVAVSEALRHFAAQQNLLPRDAAVFLAPSMYFYPPLQPGGDEMHRSMMRTACSSLSKSFSKNGKWSRFAHHICDTFARTGKIDWSLPMAHPRVFNISFTKHQMFNSWNSDSAKSQTYKSVDDFKELQVTTPEDLLKQITTGSMNAFDYEQKALALKICEKT